MAVDPRKAAEDYLEQHKVPQLLEALTAQLLFNKPDDPKSFIVKYMENAKLAGTPPLLNQEDLQTMFAMFDVTNRGVVTSEQANNALRSILGPAADLQDVGVAPKAILTRDQFVKAMMEALHMAIPYKR
mmetsp:Transcript_23808/g.52192  ORF Transcript_23808/g.52192 Transcript_23808/m.52192 type:complete len:129 (-) Transcript_23808:638-1024(-)|eukprot:CAMPEP_0202902602 /NCGR_PEP_ID=MMETSP1392-20130828/16947_1 /ASSEMBLY_ACC=CAM_ASM_000868 /TAXON_ID=225041 /ORGANISM="Chlamydomonas chlamydogama, Strain SAG 11-48b" /LENGTH=128 /DNA_ID=CAMNT_0049589391 /DNA_START=238 /DNA_END=624 /DNA_ORIENTATION=-